MRRFAGRWGCVAVLLVSAGVLTACGGGPATVASGGSPSATGPSVGASSPTASSQSEPFVSTNYRYSVTSTDWTGTDAATAWDGTGSPGDGDLTVDVLTGPEGQRAFAYGEPTKATLQRFVHDSRATNATVHPCPARPPTTRSTTAGGQPAVLDEMHCPANGGPFVVTAFAISGGRAYVFFTYSIPAGSESFTRKWFESLLKDISFAVPTSSS